MCPNVTQYQIIPYSEAPVHENCQNPHFFGGLFLVFEQ